MKTLDRLKLFSILFVLGLNLSSFAQNNKSGKPAERGAKKEISTKKTAFPKPTGLLNDFKGVLAPDDKKKIEDVLLRLQKVGKIDWAIAIIETTGEKPIIEYSLEMAKEWKIGSQNGGLLLVIAIKDRKWWHQIDKKLEQKLSNTELIDAGDLMKEDFRAEKYAAGLKKHIEKLIEILAGKYDFSPIRFA